jgi:aminoglycoside phosphotransferase (APT) family kinase protein
VAAVALTSSEALADASPRVALWEFVAATGLNSLVLAPSKDPNAKVTLLLVSPKDAAPVFAVKVPTTAAAEAAVGAEAALLEQLRAEHPGPVVDCIPRVVARVDYERRTAFVTTALPGTPMSTSYVRGRRTRSPKHVAADFEAAGAWLAQLQRATARGKAPLALLGGVRERLCNRFARDALLPRAVELLPRIDERLARDAVPRTVVHGDFWFGNVLLSRGRVSGVVDWEAATTCGEPVRDLVRFANMYALYLDRRTRPGRRVPGHRGLRAERWGAALEYAIDGRGWFPTLYRRFLEDGLARLGAARSSWRDAALAGIAEVAAVTDHDDFARLHLELFCRLAEAAA